jgi:hypothetical protein
MNDMPVFIPEKPLSTAVLFLIFNRLDTKKQFFDTIKQAKPPRLYIAADGARDSRTGEREICRTVKDDVMSILTGSVKLKPCLVQKTWATNRQ